MFKNEIYIALSRMQLTYIAFNNYRFAVQVDVRRGDSKCDVCGILPMRYIRHVDTDAIYIAMKR